MTDDKDFRLLIGELEKIYGEASSSGFGSAVFYEEMPENNNPADLALKHYRDFIGAGWTAETEPGWLSGWKNVYTREPGRKPDILTELGQITDPGAKLAIPLLTELVQNVEAGKKALSALFDHPSAKQLTINLVGDAAMLTGVMVTGIFSDKKVCSVICLLD